MFLHFFMLPPPFFQEAKPGQESTLFYNVQIQILEVDYCMSKKS